MTSSDSGTSNECKTKEKDFENMLRQMFREKEQEYEGVDRVIHRIKLEQEQYGKTNKEDRE